MILLYQKKNKVFFVVLILTLLVLVYFVHPTNRNSYVQAYDSSYTVAVLETLGGRLGLSKDNIIAFDAKGTDGYYDLYTMQWGDSTHQRITHESKNIPQKHNGNPSWHPDGNYIVFQSVDPSLQGLPPRYHDIEMALTGPGAGVNNNLWITDKKGSVFYQLTHVTDKNGVLHPHFSHDGKKIVWMSSKDIPQKIQQYKVKTDYWIMDRNGKNKQRLTYFNDPQSEYYVPGGAIAADCDWFKDGSALIGYLIFREGQRDYNVLIEWK
jgi:dipeptidyl aminopeptidase/acylaminoacyl peptidase